MRVLRSHVRISPFTLHRGGPECDILHFQPFDLFFELCGPLALALCMVLLNAGACSSAVSASQGLPACKAPPPELRLGGCVVKGMGVKLPGDVPFIPPGRKGANFLAMCASAQTSVDVDESRTRDREAHAHGHARASHTGRLFLQYIVSTHRDVEQAFGLLRSEALDLLLPSMASMFRLSRAVSSATAGSHCGESGGRGEDSGARRTAACMDSGPG